jgi:Ser/Thr protein kinase RdoA (MazF antagonist)
MSEIEKPLYGGLVDGRVFKVGDTVRRPAGPWTPTIHALLAHLHAKGFPCPKPLGLDPQGREILSYLRGHCSAGIWPDALRATSGARQVGAMLRAYQDAVADFVPPDPPVWCHGPQALAPGEVVIHGDFGPHNLIWSSDALAGVIDFELARPGRPEEDAVFGAVRAVPLRPDAFMKAAGFDSVPDRRARLAAFAEGYGKSDAEILEPAIAVRVAERQRAERLAAAGIEPWAGFIRRGLHLELAREQEWFAENLSTFLP